MKKLIVLVVLQSLIGCKTQITSDEPINFYIKVLSPNGSEVINSIDSLEITWNSNSNKFNISISYNGGKIWDMIVREYSSQDFRYIMKPEQSSDSCLIRVEDFYNPKVYDISDSFFSVKTLTDYFPIDEIKSWTYSFDDYHSFNELHYIEKIGTKKWEYINKIENSDSTNYLFTETFDYIQIDAKLNFQTGGYDYDTTTHFDIMNFNIIEYKENKILINPIDTTGRIPSNFSLKRYYDSVADSLWIGGFGDHHYRLGKEIGILYLEFWEGTVHAMTRMKWNLLEYSK